MPEHWFCKPEVVGSSPTASFPQVNVLGEVGANREPMRVGRTAAETGRYPQSLWSGRLPDAPLNSDGQMAERPMAPDCKSGGLSPTQVRILLCPLGAHLPFADRA